MKTIGAVLIAFLLFSCATKQQSDNSAIPDLVSYSLEYQRELAKALETAPTIIQDTVTDYGKLRKAIKAAKAVDAK